MGGVHRCRAAPRAAFSSTGAKYLIANGGRHPLWAPDGKGLYFSQLPLQREALRLVSVTTQPTFAFGNPVPQPSGALRGGFDVLERQFDITPDGTRFIAVVDATQNQDEAPVAPQFHVVLNWFDELKQRVPRAPDRSGRAVFTRVTRKTAQARSTSSRRP